MKEKEVPGVVRLHNGNPRVFQKIREDSNKEMS